MSNILQRIGRTAQHSHRVALAFLFAFCTLHFASCFAQPPQRVPAYRGVIERIQPSGDTLHIYLRGDEWNHYTMTTDGYEVRENQKGKICYVRLKKNGEKKTTNRQAQDADKRSRCTQKWLNKHGVKHN